MDWQDISTAPKDGTDILVWDGEAACVAAWDDTLAGTVAPSCWALYNRFGVDAVQPTHWMPLPPPPTEDTE